MEQTHDDNTEQTYIIVCNTNTDKTSCQLIEQNHYSFYFDGAYDENN